MIFVIKSRKYTQHKLGKLGPRTKRKTIIGTECTLVFCKKMPFISRIPITQNSIQVFRCIFNQIPFKFFLRSIALIYWVIFIVKVPTNSGKSPFTCRVIIPPAQPNAKSFFASNWFRIAGNRSHRHYAAANYAGIHLNVHFTVSHT